MDSEDAQQIREDIFFTGESDPSQIGRGDRHRELFGTAGRNRQKKFLRIAGLEERVADEEIPCAVKCEEQAVICHIDDDTGGFFGSDSFMSDCNRSRYEVRKAPRSIAGTGHEQRENDLREQEEIPPQGKKEQQIGGIK